MKAGGRVTVNLDVTEWERVLHALASHDRRLWDVIAGALRDAVDEEHRRPMVWPWR